MKTPSRITEYWNAVLRIGLDPVMDQTQQTRLFAVNAFLLIAFILTLIFVFVFVLLGSYSALQGLVIIPVVLGIFYFNFKSWFKVSRILVTYGLMGLVLVLALSDRRTGTEYILIALGCCSVVIYEEIGGVILSFAFAFACYAFYAWYDFYFPFTADPRVPYLLSQNFIMFLSGFAVLAQSLVFRFLINDYAAKLNTANNDVESVNEALKASNEQLKTFSENLDLAVREKGARLQAYNDAINTSIYSATLDHEGIFLSVNDPLLVASGYTQEELIGQHYKILNTNQLTGDQLQGRYQRLAAGSTWTGELRYKSKSGSLFWIECVIMPIKEADGGIKEFLSLGIPITERKFLEVKNLSAIQALEDIAFRTSHNIRGPLARVTGLTALLKMNAVGIHELNYVAQKLVESSAELDEATHELTVFVNEHQKIIVNRDQS
ncbi:MAG: PAS domain S-box protein [Chryseolinea sp.]